MSGRRTWRRCDQAATSCCIILAARAQIQDRIDEVQAGDAGIGNKGQMQYFIHAHAGQTSDRVDGRAKQRVECHVQLGGQQVAVVLIEVGIQDRFCFRNRRARIILGGGN